MVSKKITVTNAQGFHMRPATVFSTAVGRFSSEVSIVLDGKQINGKSPMNIMAAGIKCGTEIEIQCSGSDEEEALRTACDLIASGFGE